MYKFILLTLCLFTNLFSADNFYYVTYPKAGTHLLGKLFELTIKRYPSRLLQKNVPFYSHCSVQGKMPQPYYSRPNQKKVLLIRDIRDICIASIFAFEKRGRNNPNFRKKYSDWFAQSMEEKIMTWISPVAPFKEFHEKVLWHLEAFFHWQNTPNTFVTSLEKLVGEKGGGSFETQHNEIKSIFRFVNVPTNKEMIEDLQENLFGESPTFRSGQIGEWKKYFTEANKEVFKHYLGQYLIELGYEQDNSW